jgi:hypothetical protein
MLASMAGERSRKMLLFPDPNLLAAFERVQRWHERQPPEQRDDPLIWTMIGVTLIALFLLAISAPWFAR